MFKRDLEQERNWQLLLQEIERLLGQKPKDLNGVLFLIGVQELGKGHHTKEEYEKSKPYSLSEPKIVFDKRSQQKVGEYEGEAENSTSQE